MECNHTALPNNSATFISNDTCVNWNYYYTECRGHGNNPFQGTISFDNIGLAWVAIFLVSGNNDFSFLTPPSSPLGCFSLIKPGHARRPLSAAKVKGNYSRLLGPVAHHLHQWSSPLILTFHCISLFAQVISLEGWTDIMYYVQDAHSFWDWIYFVLLIVVS